MRKKAVFESMYLENGHLSIPRKIVDSLSLKGGEKVRVALETERFDKKGFLGLFGIWKDKDEADLELYREIVKEREIFGRGEFRL